MSDFVRAMEMAHATFIQNARRAFEQEHQEKMRAEYPRTRVVIERHSADGTRRILEQVWEVERIEVTKETGTVRFVQEGTSAARIFDGHKISLTLHDPVDTLASLAFPQKDDEDDEE